MANIDSNLKIIQLKNIIKCEEHKLTKNQLKKMKKILFNLEYELALQQGNKYIQTGDINVFY